MAKHVKSPTELEDKALDAVHGGSDPLHLLAQVNHLSAQGTSSRKPAPGASKGIIAVLIG